MMPYNKMDFVEQCFRVVRDVYVVMALAAPIVDIDSWLKTPKMSKRLEELEERAHESFSNDGSDASDDSDDSDED